jgi:hypothetical protein
LVGLFGGVLARWALVRRALDFVRGNSHVGFKHPPPLAWAQETPAKFSMKDFILNWHNVKGGHF